MSDVIGNGKPHPRSIAEVAHHLRGMFAQLTNHLRHPLADPVQAITLDARLATDVCVAMAKLWRVAQSASRLRAAWIHHVDRPAFSEMLKDVYPRLVPTIEEIKNENPQNPPI